jgi:hypothetical protein
VTGGIGVDAAATGSENAPDIGIGMLGYAFMSSGGE